MAAVIFWLACLAIVLELIDRALLMPDEYEG